jgi:hypothetical protein
MVIEPVSRRTRGRSRGRLIFWIAGGAILASVVAGLVVLARPQVTLADDPLALGRITLSGVEGRVVSVSVRDADGRAMPVSVRNAMLWPTAPIRVNERLVVHLKLHRPSWVGWLLGRTKEETFVVRAPAAQVERRWLLTPSHGPVTVTFATPVTAVRIRRGTAVSTLHFAQPRSEVVVGHVVPGRPRAGTVTVSAVPRTWETLPRPVRVSWFPVGDGTQAVAEPTLGRRLRMDQPITITFAKPVKQVLGDRLPAITPNISGHWRAPDAHTITFQPTSFGYPVGGRVIVHLPEQLRVASNRRVRALGTLAWNVPDGSILRLQQLLAEDLYLPVRWDPAADPVALTARSQAKAAADPPAGRFSWRYANTPPELRALWRPGTWNAITRAAVMMFEDTHGLNVDGFVGPEVWHALLVDIVAGNQNGSGYSYVFVHRNLPQSLNLWHDGQVILSSPGNTGVPAAPTQLGTFPVFEHISVGTMSGTNPDGTHYHDPGIRYISYFNHGDAIHAFNRASFGTPQSLGCVELPLDAAAKVWPYTPIGTLVTIED